MEADLGEREEVVQGEHAEGTGPFEERVEHLGRRVRVGERAVAGLDGDPEVTGEGAELQIVDLVVEQPPGHPEGVRRAGSRAAARPGARARRPGS